VSFTRTKKQGARTYYQLVESYREDGKVRQRMLAHLGHYPSLEAAIEGYSAAAARARHYESTFHLRGQSGPKRQMWLTYSADAGRRAEYLEAKAESLRACSAQLSPAGGRILGTTPTAVRP
jgi:hypothetical protein